MIRCVMSAREPDVVESLPPSSVLMSPVSNTTVSTAGLRSMLVLVVSSISHWLKKELIGQGPYLSDGVEVILDVQEKREYCAYGRFENHGVGSFFVTLRVFCIIFVGTFLNIASLNIFLYFILIFLIPSYDL